MAFADRRDAGMSEDKLDRLAEKRNNHYVVAVPMLSPPEQIATVWLVTMVSKEKE